MRALHGLRRTEKDWSRRFREGARYGIVGVEHGQVRGALVLEQSRLGGGVAFEGVVAIEMIRRDVERDSDVGSEGVDGFQLEAGEFEDVPLAGLRGLDHRARRRADVAAYLRGDAAGFQDVAGERGGRG